MKNIKDFFITCIGLICGTILLLIIILFWVIALVLTTMTELMEWVELKLTNLMKKCYGEEL
jgi:hypothetical protein